MSDEAISRFRKRAEELRVIAGGMKSAIHRATIERLADDYEKMADRIEKLEMRTRRPAR